MYNTVALIVFGFANISSINTYQYISWYTMLLPKRTHDRVELLYRILPINGASPDKGVPNSLWDLKLSQIGLISVILD